MRVLVAGAGGFIGSHFVKYLKGLGYWVRGVDTKYPEFWNTMADEFYISDLRYFENCMAAMQGGIYHVYNFAANMGGIGFIETHKAEIVHDNTLISLHMLDAAHKSNVKRFFYTSSACVYPGYKQDTVDLDKSTLREEDAYPADPEDGDGWEKLYTERMCRHYREDLDLDTRVVRFHNIYGPCFDKRTEILTRDGFKFFKDLEYSDKIATLNPKTNDLEYHNPDVIQSYHYSGRMHHFLSTRIDLLVTPDHQIYTKKSLKKKNYEIKKVKDCSDYERFYFKRNCNAWEGENFGALAQNTIIEEVRYEDGRSMTNRGGRIKQVSTKTWLSFLGWFLTEGSCFKTPSNYIVCITQKNEKNRDEIIKLIADMNYSYYLNGEKNILINSKQLYEKLKYYGHAKEKYIPREYLMRFPKEYLLELFKSMMKGDGDLKRNRFSTSSKQLADNFQELLFKLGYGSIISYYNDMYRVLFSEKPDTKVINTSIVDYNDFVYDVTVKNHIIFVRRNGRACWSGNCGTYQGGREKSPAAICRKIALAKDGDAIEVWGDGEQRRSYCYVNDCIDGIHKLMESDYCQPLNLGNDEMISINQLVDIVAKIAGKKIHKEYDLTKPVGVRGRNSDNTKLKKILDWEPEISLEDGLRKTYNWIREQLRQ